MLTPLPQATGLQGWFSGGFYNHNNCTLEVLDAQSPVRGHYIER